MSRQVKCLLLYVVALMMDDENRTRDTFLFSLARYIPGIFATHAHSSSLQPLQHLFFSTFFWRSFFFLLASFFFLLPAAHSKTSKTRQKTPFFALKRRCTLFSKSTA